MSNSLQIIKPNPLIKFWNKKKVYLYFIYNNSSVLVTELNKYRNLAGAFPVKFQPIYVHFDKSGIITITLKNEIKYCFYFVATPFFKTLLFPKPLFNFIDINHKNNIYSLSWVAFEIYVQRKSKKSNFLKIHVFIIQALKSIFDLKIWSQ